VCLAVAVLAGVAAGIGVFLRGDGATGTAISVRGEVYEMATNGVYAFNAERLVAEGVGWDVFTLFVAVPALLIVVPWLARGSFRARLLAIGLLGYFFYQYLMYATTWAFGPLFPLFIAIEALSLAGIVWVAAAIGPSGLQHRFSERFPRRGMAALSIGLAVLLIVMWSQRITTALRSAPVDQPLLGQTTMVVQALDLGLIVPLVLFTGVMVWRGHALGQLLASVVVVKMVAMTAAICAMLLSAWAVEGSLEVAPFAVFAVASVIATALGIRMHQSVLPAEASPPVPSGARAQKVGVPG
jgi:hypothetical protein